MVRRAFVLVTAAVVLAVAGTAAPPCVGADPLDADVIFARTIAAVGAAAYPRYASYAIAVAFTKDGTRLHDTWETSEDLAHATVFTRVFSREEEAHPSTPHGMDIVLPFLGNLNRAKPRDPIGVVAFAANQTFGLVPQSFSVARDRSDFSDAARNVRVIGRTATRVRRYAVTLLGTDADGSATVDHLGLTPLVDPKRDRLRELWVDDASGMPRAAIVAGIGNRPPLTRVRWHVTFAQVQGGLYLSRETALEPVDYGGDGVLGDVSFAFEQLDLRAHDPLAYSFGINTPVQAQADP